MTKEELADQVIFSRYGAGDFNEHDWYDSAKECFLAGYKAAKPKWIKLEDQEPQDMQIVLMTMADWRGYVITAQYDCDGHSCSFLWGLPNGHLIRSYTAKDGDIYWMPMIEGPSDGE